MDRRKFKGTNLFILLFSSIKLELDELAQFIEETAESLKRKQDEINQQYEDAVAGSEDDSEAAMYYSDDLIRYHKSFPLYAFNSLLVTQHAFIENYLREVCRLYERFSFSNVRVSDLNGSDIDKAKNYLNLIAEVDLITFSKDNWERIKFIQSLRNNIVHNSSKIENTSQNNNLINHIKKEMYLEYDERARDFFINNVVFLQEYNQVIFRFFKELTDHLSKTSKVKVTSKLMQHNNVEWGIEKTGNVLESIAISLNVLEELEGSIPTGSIANLHRLLGEMAYDSSKLLAFFSGAKWNPSDRDLVMNEKGKGLEKLRDLYS